MLSENIKTIRHVLGALEHGVTKDNLLNMLDRCIEDALALEATIIPTASRDVPAGESWAFKDHRTLAEVNDEGSNVVALKRYAKWPVHQSGQPEGGAA